MPSTAQPPWERIVNDVLLPGNHGYVTAAANRWEVAFRQVDSLRESLEKRSKESAETWRGGGANAFRAHLGKLIQALATTADAHRKVVHGLRAAAGHLEAAFRAIPIPWWLAEEIRQKQLAVHNGGVVAGYAPGAFLAHFELQYPGVDPEAAKKYVDGCEAQARQGYTALCEGYRQALGDMPKGTRVAVPAARPERSRGAGTTAGQAQPTAPQQAGLPATAPTPPSTGLPGGLDPGQLPEFEPIDPGLDIPDPPDPVGIVPFDPVDVADTGLAGLGGGLGGAGGAVGGLGAGGGGIKVPPLTEAALPPEGVMEPARTAAGAKGHIGRPATGGGYGGGLNAPMAMPGAAGLPPGGGELSRTSELIDPFSPFIVDDAVPPGVLEA